jgi:phospholipase/carboxylesterase
MWPVHDPDANSSPTSTDFSPPPTRWLEPAGAPCAALLLLHGLDMTPDAIAPMLRALKLPAVVALPAGPVARPGGRRAWWPVDDAQRAARLRRGPGDLHDSHPPGRDAARAHVHAVARELRTRSGGLPLLLAGFSQGAMLALDCALQAPPLAVEALALWSGSRLAFREWAPELHRLRGVPVHVVHGRADADLGIAAGEALRDALAAEGALVRWSPFDGGHEIPLAAWVGLRRLVRELSPPAAR